MFIKTHLVFTLCELLYISHHIFLLSKSKTIIDLIYNNVQIAPLLARSIALTLDFN